MTKKGKAVAPVKQANTKRRKAPGGRFVKGVSGNPKGRPRTGLAAAEIVRHVGDEAVGKATRLEVIVRRLFKQAAAGNVHAAVALFDRGWGKPALPVDRGGVTQERLTIEVVELAKRLPSPDGPP